MKYLLYALIITASLSRQLAAAEWLTVEDIAQITGTPVAEEPWFVTEYKTDDQGLLWAWLDSDESSALLILPRVNAIEVSAPWGEAYSAEAPNVLLVIKSDKQITYSITRFGGEILAAGDSLKLRYYPETTEASTGNFYDLTSVADLSINGDHRASFQVSGAVIKITGGESRFDELYGPDTDTDWQLDDDEGLLQATTWPQTVEFNNIEVLIGSAYNDAFLLLSDSTQNSIDGAGGNDSISASGNLFWGAEADKADCVNAKENQVSLQSTVSYSAAVDYEAVNVICDEGIMSIAGTITANVTGNDMFAVSISSNVESTSYSGRSKQGGKLPFSIIAILAGLVLLRYHSMD